MLPAAHSSIMRINDTDLSLLTLDPIQVIDPIPFTGLDWGPVHLPSWLIELSGPALAALVSAFVLWWFYRGRTKVATWVAVALAVIGYGFASFVGIFTSTVPEWVISPADAQALTGNHIANEIYTQRGWEVIVADLPVNTGETKVRTRPLGGNAVQCTATDTDDSQASVTLRMDCPEALAKPVAGE